MSCSPRFLVRRSSALKDVVPFDNGRMLLTHLGRNAVWQAIHILGLKPADEILVPAYNCGSEIDPLLHHNLTVVPYRVSRSAKIDLEDILNRITQNTKAIYVTHYFGFPQYIEPVIRLSREKQLFLIEDCALALFSRDGDDFVGHKGDIAVFSFRKTLQVPDGGATLVNNPGLQMAGPLENPPLPPVLSALVPSVGRFVQRWSHIEWEGIERSYRLMRNGINRLRKRRSPADTKDEFVKVNGIDRPSLSRNDYYDPKISHWSMSPISRRIIENINPRLVVSKRRANFQYLLEALSDVPQVKPLFEQLPEGVCPTVFPLLTERQAELYTGLIKRRIDAIKWWAGHHPGICWAKFPDAVYLKTHMIALPIHHELGQDEMAYIAESVRKILV
jgi:perosamine synthetase